MNRKRSTDLAAGLLILLFGTFLLSNLSRIPFHPDEASLLYQSRDFEGLFNDPLALSFNPNQMDDVVQTYRILNPPLTKYILAIGRIMAGFGPESVSIDWDWSLTWDENSVAGALPASELLNASRAASTIMLILCLVLIYLCGKRIQSPALGILAVLLLGTNALVLLHGRRAMAEGALLFGISLALLGILEGDKQPWLAGLGTAIAVCTKLSAAALAPIALIAVLWVPSSTKSRIHIRNVTVFLLIFMIVYLLLNPLVWTNPLKAIQAQWTERTQFIQGMKDEFKELAPNQVLDDPLERLGVMIAHLFISEPQFAEVGNYLEATAASEATYCASAFSSLFRGLIWGGLFLTITVLGVAFWVLEFRKLDWEVKRKTTLLFLSSLTLFLALIWANPLPFQRYYIPLIPCICLWIGLGIMLSFQKTKQAISETRQPEKDGK